MIDGRDRLRIAAALLVAALLPLGAGAGSKERAERADPARLFELGRAHLEQGRADLAVPVLEKLISLEPDNHLGRYTLALAYYGKQDLDRAERELGLLLERDPLFTEAHNLLGIIFDSRGERPRARQEFERVLADKRYAKPETAHYNLGSLLLGDGRFEEAIPHLRSAVQVRPELVEWRYRLGLALARAGQPEAARREFEAAVTGEAGFVEAWFELGRVALSLGDGEAARRAFARVRELRPDSPLAAEAERALAGDPSGR